MLSETTQTQIIMSLIAQNIPLTELEERIKKPLSDMKQSGYDEGITDYEDIGIDGDGFHYDSINIPENFTLN